MASKKKRKVVKKVQKKKPVSKLKEVKKKRRKLTQKIENLKVPAEIYSKIFEEIKTPRSTDYLQQQQQYEPHLPLKSQIHCHQSTENLRATNLEGMLNHVNFLKAAKYALELRDFKNLYKIVIKGYETGNKRLNILLFEYLYMAIKLDPLIENREDMLKEAIQNCKLMYTSMGTGTVGRTVFEFPNEESILRHISYDHKIAKKNFPIKGCIDPSKLESQEDLI